LKSALAVVASSFGALAGSGSCFVSPTTIVLIGLAAKNAVLIV
jgi:hypothetical protein